MVWLGLSGLGQVSLGSFCLSTPEHPARWKVEAKVGCAWLGRGVGSGGIHLALEPSRHLGSVHHAATVVVRGVSADSVQGMPGGGGGMGEGLPWTRLAEISPSSLPLFCPLPTPQFFKKE